MRHHMLRASNYVSGFTLAGINSQTGLSSQTSQTFNNAPLGPGVSKHVIVVVGMEATSGMTTDGFISSITIAGTSATIRCQFSSAAGSQGGLAIADATVSASTGDVVVNFNTAYALDAFEVVTIYAPDSTTFQAYQEDRGNSGEPTPVNITGDAVGDDVLICFFAFDAGRTTGGITFAASTDTPVQLYYTGDVSDTLGVAKIENITDTAQTYDAELDDDTSYDHILVAIAYEI